MIPKNPGHFRIFNGQGNNPLASPFGACNGNVNHGKFFSGVIIMRAPFNASGIYPERCVFPVKNLR